MFVCAKFVRNIPNYYAHCFIGWYKFKLCVFRTACNPELHKYCPVSPWRLNLLRWCLIFVGLEFWSGLYIFGKFLHFNAKRTFSETSRYWLSYWGTLAVMSDLTSSSGILTFHSDRKIGTASLPQSLNGASRHSRIFLLSRSPVAQLNVLTEISWFSLTFWRRNYFFKILVHPVYKMWIIQEPNTLELWNKLHLKKKRRVYTMFKIFSTYICWINI